jgi:hypothetical protein
MHPNCENAGALTQGADKTRIRMVTKIEVETTLVIDPGLGAVRYWRSSLQIDGAAFRRDRNAKIFTNEPEKVCLALGIPYPNRQVVQEK